MPSKSKTKKNISPTSLSTQVDTIPDDLDSLKRGQLQSLAKKFGISAASKSETIKQNLLKLRKTVKLSHTTRLDTQLPKEIQDMVFEKVYDMANPEIEERIKAILDVTSYVGDSNIIYNYSKIREKLKIKHNIKPKELQEKVEKFRHIYVRMGVIYHYFRIKEITEYFEINPVHLREEHFDVYNSHIYNTERPLRTAINDYNKRAETLKKEYGSYFDPLYIDEVNDFIKYFRKVAKYDKTRGKIPYLKYGTPGSTSLKSNHLSRKTRSLKEYVKKSSRTRTRSRRTRSI